MNEIRARAVPIKGTAGQRQSGENPSIRYRQLQTAPVA